MANADPLRVRLFGYGVPYRVRLAYDGTVQPLETGPAREAGDLARELAAMIGLAVEETMVEEGAWALSMPFGRCGVEGLPREYLIVHHLEEGYLDVLAEEGCKAHPLNEGEMVQLVPGMVARVRGRPLPGRRVVVAFQTEDRTPLMGNAAPFTVDGLVPEGYSERLVKCHTAFRRMQELAEKDVVEYRERLDAFFRNMEEGLAGNQEVHRVQEEARIQGTYDVEDQGVLFGRQRELLNEDVIEGIRKQDEKLFRFPGMFGGITTLFNLIE